MNPPPCSIKYPVRLEGGQGGGDGEAASEAREIERAREQSESARERESGEWRSMEIKGAERTPADDSEERWTTQRWEGAMSESQPPEPTQQFRGSFQVGNLASFPPTPYKTLIPPDHNAPPTNTHTRTVTHI